MLHMNKTYKKMMLPRNLCCKRISIYEVFINWTNVTMNRSRSFCVSYFIKCIIFIIDIPHCWQMPTIPQRMTIGD